MLDSNQPSTSSSTQESCFLPRSFLKNEQFFTFTVTKLKTNDGWLAGRQAEEAPTQDLEFLELS